MKVLREAGAHLGVGLRAGVGAVGQREVEGESARALAVAVVAEIASRLARLRESGPPGR